MPWDPLSLAGKKTKNRQIKKMCANTPVNGRASKVSHAVLNVGPQSKNQIPGDATQRCPATPSRRMHMTKMEQIKPRLPMEAALKLRKCGVIKDKRKQSLKYGCRKTKGRKVNNGNHTSLQFREGASGNKQA